MARKSGFQPMRESVALVGDGQTERIYFADVRDTDRPKNLSIFPDYPRRIGSYKGVLQRASQLTEDYSRVYALIDSDKIIQDNQQKVYAKDKKAAEDKGVIVLENNPCFEIWLLLHFGYTTRSFRSCGELTTELSRKIAGYNKSESFLQQAGLYKNYKKALLMQAMPNAQNLEKEQQGQKENYPRAQVVEFFEWYLSRV